MFLDLVTLILGLILRCPSLREAVTQQLVAISHAPVELVGPPRPWLVADDQVHDFGFFWAGPVLRHEFKVTNVSEHILWVQVRPVAAGTFIIPYVRFQSGEIIALPVAMNTENFRFHGRFEKLWRLHPVIEQDDICTMCWHEFESQEHLQKCGPVCADRPSLPADSYYVVGKLDPLP